MWLQKVVGVYSGVSTLKKVLFGIPPNDDHEGAEGM